MKTALLVIDVQSYFLRQSPAELPARIRAHIDRNKYDHVFFTVFQNIHGSNYEQSLGFSVCNEPRDLQLPPEFADITNPRNTFTKHTYSVFKSQKFKDFLAATGVKQLHICGVDTDACVLATAFEAFDLGYRVRVLFDLCYSRSGLDPAMQRLITRNLQDKSGDIR